MCFGRTAFRLTDGRGAALAGDAASVRFIRNTPGLVPLADKHTKRLVNTQVIERRLVQAIVAQGSPLAGAG